MCRGFKVHKALSKRCKDAQYQSWRFGKAVPGAEMGRPVAISEMEVDDDLMAEDDVDDAYEAHEIERNRQESEAGLHERLHTDIAAAPPPILPEPGELYIMYTANSWLPTITRFYCKYKVCY